MILATLDFVVLLGVLLTYVYLLHQSSIVEWSIFSKISPTMHFFMKQIRPNVLLKRVVHPALATIARKANLVTVVQGKVGICLL